MLTRYSRDSLRPRLSPTLLIIGMALAVAAVYQALQAVRSHRQASARLIRDYGAFAAWSFRQHAGEALRQTIRKQLVPVVHALGRSGTVTAARWRSELDSAEQDPPCDGGCNATFYFRFVLTSPARAEFVGDTLDPPAREAIVAAVRQHAATPARPSSDYALVHPVVRGTERDVVYALVEGGSGPVAYGFDFDAARFAPLLRDVFGTQELLPRVVTGGRPNAELIGVRVQDGDHVVFTAPDSSGWAQATTEPFGAQLGDLVVHAAILSRAVAPLAGGTITRSRLPLFAGLMALACALAIVAVYQMRRDAELARMRSDFVSSVSHELRTPLAQIQVFLEMLRFGRHRTEEQRTWILESMQRETTRLTALVENVLHFSRAERGLVGGTRETMPLDDFVRGLVADFSPLAASRNVTLDTSLRSGALVRLHAESFRQVLLNLLDNAVKYGPKGQTVRISTENGGDRARIVVDDEGPGVEPHERSAIFDAFRRGDKAIGSVTAGSGIGLSIARDIVRSHDGTLNVTSAPAGGARFVIDLPRT